MSTTMEEVCVVLTSTDIAKVKSHCNGKKQGTKAALAYIETARTKAPCQLNTKTTKGKIKSIEFKAEAYDLLSNRMIELMTDEDDILKQEADAEGTNALFEQIIDDLQILLTMAEDCTRAEELGEEAARMAATLKPSNIHHASRARDILTTLSDIRRKIKSLPESDRLKMESYSAITTKATALLDDFLGRGSHTAPTAATVDSTPSSVHADTGYRMKVPDRTYPRFSGKIMEWASFWKRFTEWEERLPSLSELDKISFLRSAVERAEGPAQFMDSETASFISYKEYADWLAASYDDQRTVARTHVKEVLEKTSNFDTTSAVQSYAATFTKFRMNLKAMKVYDIDHILTAVAELHMPDGVMKEWKLFSKTKRSLPHLDVLLEFFKDLALSRPREARTEGHRKNHPQKTLSAQPQGANQHSNRATVFSAKLEEKCPFCEAPKHSAFYCDTFKAMSVTDRNKKVRTLKLCTNCISAYHQTSQCKSTKTCKSCNGKHHTMLHRDTTPSTSNTTIPDGSNTIALTQSIKQASLLTAYAVFRSGGRQQRVRVVLDNGAATSMVTRKLADTLHVKRSPGSTNLNAIDGRPIQSQHKQVELELMLPNRTIRFTASVIDQFAGNFPMEPSTFNKEDPILKNITYADPGFNEPAPIQALLGIGVTGIFPQVVTHSEDECISLHHTPLGTAISIRTMAPPSDVRISNVRTASLDQATHDMVQNFWTAEQEPEPEPTFSDESQRAVDNFQKTTTILTDGRFRVQLPRKEFPPTLGRSREKAVCRYLQNQRSLKAKGKWDDFSTGVDEYLSMGHAERVPTIDLHKATEDVYYLPMHGVLKISSTTTKLRIVFDGSSRTSTGHSLNDTMLAGPNLYPKLVNIIGQFRNNKYALTSDIAKMFRVIDLDPKDRDHHRFVHVNTDGILIDYRMTRLTFGIRSSPFLATQVLRAIAEGSAAEHADVARTLTTQFYVDDCVTGTNDLEKAIEIRSQLNEALQKHGMTLRKWRSNSQAVLRSIPEELRESTIHPSPVPKPQDHAKALGIHWNTETDVLHIATPDLSTGKPMTKRMMASDYAKSFDVMGWFTPSLLCPKLLIQEMWARHFGWEEKAPPDIQERWDAWAGQLPLLTTKSIPRHYFDSTKTVRTIQLHGFSDASTIGMAAVVYVRAFYEDLTVTTSIVISKTRLPPVKSRPETSTIKPSRRKVSPELSVPRLELNGAVILSKLLAVVAKMLAIPFSNVHAWCDATTILQWLRGDHAQLQPYESNRIRVIRELTPVSVWRHVPTDQNPADLASRGLMPQQLLKSDLWWHGPSWLLKAPDEWPNRVDFYRKSSQPTTPTIISVVSITPAEPLVDLTSDIDHWIRKKRVIAYVQRFVHRALSSTGPYFPTSSLTLSMDELRRAERTIILMHQQQAFPKEIKALRSLSTVSANSKLHNLNPFLDRDSTLRVGGRIQNASISTSAKHPIILEGRADVVKALVRWYHTANLHLGAIGVRGVMSSRYFISGARRAIRAVTSSCSTCRKEHALASKQLMGNLPSCRLAVKKKCFYETGVDYAGPVTIKLGYTRKPAYVKGYLAIFICMTYKAVTLDVVMDLTISSFRDCLRRFVSRRGKPYRIWSDNGANFIGAKKEMTDLFRLINSPDNQREITDSMSSASIIWENTPPRSPHFGGLWESTVKSVKRHLRKTVGSTALTMPQMFTTLLMIEAVLNSRPLVPYDDSPDGGSDILTPGHFITGEALVALPEQSDLPERTLNKQYNLAQHLSAMFWQRWRREYLSTLQQRAKWRAPKRNLRIGDLVLLKDEEAFAQQWPRGIIRAVYPGPDGYVRAVDVEIAQTVSPDPNRKVKNINPTVVKRLYRRPVVKIVLLLPEEKEDLPAEISTPTEEDVEDGEPG